MRRANDNNQRLQMFALLVVGVLFLSGCNHSATDAATATNERWASLSQPVRVSSAETEAAEPAIAASADGSAYVAWVNHAPDGRADVMVSRFSADGKTLGSAVRVNSMPGIAKAWRGDPPTIAVARDHTVFVGWTARRDSEASHDTDIYLSSSRDAGQTFGAPVKVNDDNRPAVHGMHSLAVADDGRIYMAWLDERNIKPMVMKDAKMKASSRGHHMETNRELFVASSADGGRTFTANQRVATNACPCCKTALATSSDGRLYVGWRQVLPGDLRHIAVASSPDHGKSFSAPVIVSDDQWVLAGCPVSGPTLSVNRNGTLSVLWYSAGKNGETGVYWGQSRDFGATFTDRRMVSGGTIVGSPVLVETNGDLFSVWQSNENGKAEVLTAELATGSSASETISLASDAELPAAAVTQFGVLIAYITNTDEHQGVWVVYQRRS